MPHYGVFGIAPGCKELTLLALVGIAIDDGNRGLRYYDIPLQYSSAAREFISLYHGDYRRKS
jgi:hypothetical protein